MNHIDSISKNSQENDDMNHQFSLKLFAGSIFEKQSSSCTNGAEDNPMNPHEYAFIKLIEAQTASRWL